MAHNNTLKMQEQLEKKKLNEYYQKRGEEFAESEKVREKENTDRQHEYRDFLLKQIDDKEKQKQSDKKNSFQQQPYSELADAIEKHSLKVLKQGEEKRGLDECVKMKNLLKSENKQKDVQENKDIAEFCERRECSYLTSEDDRKKKAEIREHKNDGVVLQLTTQKNEESKNRDLQREKVMDVLIEKQMADLGDECPSDLHELHEKIRIKRELLEQSEKKIAMFLQNLEETRMIQQKLMYEIAEEEERLEQELKENERQRYLLHDTMPQNSHHGIKGNQIKEMNFDFRKQKTQNVSN